MLKKRLLLVAALVLGGLAVPAAEPTPEMLKARQETAAADAVLLGNADLAAVFKTPAGIKLRDGWMKNLEKEFHLERELGIKFGDFSHMNLVCRVKGRLDDHYNMEGAWLVLVESETVDLFAKLKEQFVKAVGERVQQAPDGKTLATLEGGSTAIWLQAPPGGQGFRMAWAQFPRSSPARNVLDCPVKLTSQPSVLSTVIKEQGKGQVVVGLRFAYPIQSLLDKEILRDLQRQAQRDNNPKAAFLNLDWLLDLDTLVVSAEAGDKLTLTLNGNFPDKDDAAAAAKRLAGTLGMLCGLVEQQIAANPEAKMLAACQELLQSVKMECQDRTLKVSLVIPDAMLQYTGGH
jgi:hypothetical protein